MMNRMGPHYTRAVRNLVAVLAAGVGATTAACLSTPPADGMPVDATPDAPMCVDVDGDGWRGNCPTDAYQDCADGDPAIHPGAVEVGSAGATVDRDCSGAGVTEVLALVDLTAQPLGSGGPGELGARITTRYGRYDFEARAGHQLTSVLVRTATGALSTELLHDGPIRERNSGVHVWDDFLAVLPDDSSLVEQVSGPAVYQALVTYRAGGTELDPSLSGTSLYTITMDGRIHRTDRLLLTEQPMYAGGADFPGVTSHVALAAAPAIGGTTFSHVAVRDGTTLLSDLLPTTAPGGNQIGGDQTNWRWSCAYGPDVEVGFTRVVPGNIGQPTRNMRIYSNPTPSYRQVALQYDWQVGMGTPVVLQEGPMRGHFLITPNARSNGECELVEAKSNAFTRPVDVVFPPPATGTLVSDVVDDEDDDGFVEAGGYWALRASSPAGIRFEFEQPSGTTLPLYATFRIAGVPPGRDPMVLIGGNRASQGVAYRLQPDGADGIWMVLMIGIQASQPIELIYPPL